MKYTIMIDRNKDDDLLIINNNSNDLTTENSYVTIYRANDKLEAQKYFHFSEWNTGVNFNNIHRIDFYIEFTNNDYELEVLNDINKYEPTIGKETENMNTFNPQVLIYTGSSLVIVATIIVSIWKRNVWTKWFKKGDK